MKAVAIVVHLSINSVTTANDSKFADDVTGGQRRHIGGPWGLWNYVVRTEKNMELRCVQTQINVILKINKYIYVTGSFCVVFLSNYE